MTEGVGGSSAQAELSELSGRTGFTAITVPERLGRIEKAQRLMVEQGIDALYLDASTNLFYFTGLRFWATERLHGAILPALDQSFLLYGPAFLGHRAIAWRNHPGAWGHHLYKPRLRRREDPRHVAVRQ